MAGVDDNEYEEPAELAFGMFTSLTAAQGAAKVLLARWKELSDDDRTAVLEMIVRQLASVRDVIQPGDLILRRRR